jgi:hypothetical protein
MYNSTNYGERRDQAALFTIDSWTQFHEIFLCFWYSWAPLENFQVYEESGNAVAIERCSCL